MKFKKAFAWILAVAMVITLMPSMAFANTTNSVSATPTVAANDLLPTTAGVVSMEVRDANGIKNGTIKLKLENATWVDGVTDWQHSNQTTQAAIRVHSDGYNGTDTDAAVTVQSSTKSTVEISFNFANAIPTKEYITLELPNAVKSGSDDGEVKLTIDGGDSAITSGTYTIATVGTSNTISTVIDDVVETDRASTVVAAPFEIRETAVNSIMADQEFKLTLPKGFEWVTPAQGTAGIPHDQLGVGDTPKTYFKGTLGTTVYDRLTDDRRTMICHLTPNGGYDGTTRGTIVVYPVINVTAEAAMGDVAVTVRGVNAYDGTGFEASDVDPDAKVIGDAGGLVIARYTEAGVKISTSNELPTIVAGKFADKNDKYYTVEVTLEETIKNALTSGRYVDISFPDEVQILSYGYWNNATAFKVKYNNDSALRVVRGNTHGITTVRETIGKDASSMEFTVPNDGTDGWKADDINKVTFTIPITVKAGFEGDIIATVSGAKAGVESTEIKVAEAIAPITVTSTAADLRNGVQKQSIGDIVITENGVGYIGDYDWVDANLSNGDNPGIGYALPVGATKDDEDSKDFYGDQIILDIDTLGLSGMVFEDFESVEVTAGDLEIGKASISSSNGTIVIPIKFRSANEASTITVKGVTVALNRTLPEGGYDLLVKGGAVVENSLCNDGGFSSNAVVAEDYVKIITPADPTTISGKLINAVFTLRQDTYIDNGETVKMDTAPYLDANNRTQLPIRYAAMACGVDESDISWNQATQTATINAGSKVLRITIGSNIMQTSDGIVTMDTAAVSSNGRIFVPIRYIANALGATVAWDQDAKTITLTN